MRIVINIDENGVGSDASSYEEEADTVLEREESDEDPDEVEELRVDSNFENHRDDDEGDYENYYRREEMKEKPKCWIWTLNTSLSFAHNNFTREQKKGKFRNIYSQLNA